MKEKGIGERGKGKSQYNPGGACVMNGRGTSLGRHEEPRKREVAIEETVKRGERRGSEDGKQGEGKGNKVDALGVCRQVLVTGGHVVKSVWINKLKQSLKKKT